MDKLTWPLIPAKFKCRQPIFNARNKRENHLIMEDRHVVLGKRIKTMRMERRMSQTECAKGIDVAQSHLSNIENGRSHVTMENLFSLRDLFNVPFSEFFIDLDREIIENKKKEMGAEVNNSSSNDYGCDDILTLSDLLEAVAFIKEKKGREKLFREK